MPKANHISAGPGQQISQKTTFVYYSNLQSGYLDISPKWLELYACESQRIPGTCNMLWSYFYISYVFSLLNFTAIYWQLTDSAPWLKSDPKFKAFLLDPCNTLSWNFIEIRRTNEAHQKYELLRRGNNADTGPELQLMFPSNLRMGWICYLE